MRASPENWANGLVLLVLLGLVFVAGGMLVLAYQSGGPPSILGHTSGEVEFTFNSVMVDCTSSSSADCVATCPVPPVGSTYFAVSGYCISQPATSAYLSSAGLLGTNSWKCRDPTHSSGGGLFRAVVNCMVSGV